MADKWKETTLGEHIDLATGEAFKSSRFGASPESGTLLARGDNVKEGVFEWGDKARYWPELTSDLERYLLCEGDVLIGMDGSKVGKNWVRVQKKDLPCLLVQRVARLRAKETMDQWFLRYLIGNPQFRNYVERIKTGTSIPHISGGQIKAYDILLPPVREQTSIAAVLGALDDKIEVNRQMNETLEALAQTLFKNRFVDAVANRLPKGWREGRLDEVLVLQRGFDLPSTKRTQGPHPVLCASGPNGTHGEFMVKGPGVTTGRSGSLGRVFFVHEDFWPHNTSLWVNEFKHSTPLFAFHLLRTLNFGIFNSGSAVPTLNRNHVHNLPVIIPPMELIQKFESTVSPMYQRLKFNDDESRTLAELRDALLPKLLSGELRVPIN